jgi:hypothetical protein
LGLFGQPRKNIPEVDQISSTLLIILITYFTVEG